MPDNPTNADLLAHLAQLHECVEGFGAQSKADNEAMGRRVDGVTSELSDLRAASEATAAHVASLIDNRETTRNLVNAKFDGLNRTAWKIVGAIAAALLTGVVAIITTVVLNGLSIRDQALAMHDASAGAHAPADDAREADRDARLLAAIAALKAAK